MVEVEPHKSSILLEHLAVAIVSQQNMAVLSAYFVGDMFQDPWTFQNVDDGFCVFRLENHLSEVLSSLFEQLVLLTDLSTLSEEAPDKPRFGAVGREIEAVELAEDEFVDFNVFDRVVGWIGLTHVVSALPSVGL